MLHCVLTESCFCPSYCSLFCFRILFTLFRKGSSWILSVSVNDRKREIVCVAIVLGGAQDLCDPAPEVIKM